MIDKTFHIVNDDLSDGFHTFDELYEHRVILFLALLHMADNQLHGWNPRVIENHFEGWDCITCELPTGQISYHVPIEKRPLYDWITERRAASDPSTYDGHTPADVVDRLTSWMKLF